jgi:hypothetical protein
MVMFRHVVMFRLVDGVSAAVREEILQGLARLAREVPEIHSFTFGVDAGLAAGNFDIAVVAEFADEAAYARYAAHPAHVEFVSKKVRPYLSERAAVQFGPA